MHCIARLLTAVMLFAAASTTAFAASESGTHAWSTDTLTLRNGPSRAYAVTGSIAADSTIKVLRCQRNWCLVDGDTGRGWSVKGPIDFGDIPATYDRGGTACFYTGTNYTGAEYCFSTGHVTKDLALNGMDNAFASVRLEGTNVSVCRDRFFQSYCERISVSQPVLNQYLVHSLSSIRVH
ncbi:MAG: SH3 domain-containing protein [Candidatus Devosia phytovorans]|uniref:SH3 domain-containing protein n=1 Tax=Candidatus Devosia phytovorans TaxID=3121372 RepID=A0AAJ5VV02_9HYPH|nr:SH3 domain-containing protein [Devosia sp.]WEK05383.1 MAG: SH3 domain-containing protein [Devosia sp.]